MVYDFDTEIDRMPTSSYKWSWMKEITGLEDLYPLWVADMDFACAPAIVEALKERVAHPIYGYTGPTDGYHNGLIKWMAEDKITGILHCWISRAVFESVSAIVGSKS